MQIFKGSAERRAEDVYGVDERVWGVGVSQELGDAALSCVAPRVVCERRRASRRSRQAADDAVGRREPLAARRVMGARPASKAGPSKEAPWGRKTGPREGGGSPHALPCHALFTHALAVWLASGELDLYGLAHHQFFYGHSAACAVLHCLHPFPHAHGAPEVGGVDSTRVPGDASEVAANIQLVLRCEARFSLVAVSLSRLAVSFQVT